jgi:hypothetical protein
LAKELTGRGGTAAALSEEDPEALLDTRLYARPSGVSGEGLSLREWRWCNRQLVRSDIFRRFSFEGEEPREAGAAQDRYDSWGCALSSPSEGERLAEAVGPPGLYGVSEVREALSEVMIRNPYLIMRLEYEVELASGAAGSLSEAEALGFLVLLGMLDYQGDGSDAALLPQALERFQAELGIQATGELDAVTAGLLRNSVFLHSLEPLLQAGTWTAEHAGGFGSGIDAGGGDDLAGAASAAAPAGLASTVAPAGSGASGEVPEDDPEAFLDPGLYGRPLSGAATPLSEREARWCRRQLVRADILLRFTPEGAGYVAGLEAYSRLEKWCPGSPYDWHLPENPSEGSRMSGILMAKEAADEARVWNPELAMDMHDEQTLSPGGPSALGPGEEVAILRALGYGTGVSSGGQVAAVPGAVKAFQEDLGLPVTGELDPRTAGLLRNAMFLHSLEPFDWR